MSHTYTNLLVHVVFSTKDRVPVLRDDLRPRLFEYMVGLARGEFGDALRLGGVSDHMHGQLAIRPDISVSQAMSRWKSLSSAWLKQQGLADFAWQAGYAAFSVSRSNVDAVCAYIDRQEEHHRRLTFAQELEALLRKHGIEFDPERFLV